MGYLENIMLSNLDSRKKQVAETITALQTAKYDYILNL